MLELLASVLCFGLFLYKWLIIIAVLLTWVSADPYNPIVQWIARVTRPLWVWCEQRMPMMLICHQGIRSRQAAQYFTSQGFQQVYNVSDGIDGWSQTVDSSIPRY